MQDPYLEEYERFSVTICRHRSKRQDLWRLHRVLCCSRLCVQGRSLLETFRAVVACVVCSVEIEIELEIELEIEIEIVSVPE